MQKVGFIYIHGVTPDIKSGDIRGYSKKFHDSIIKELGRIGEDTLNCKRFEITWAQDTFPFKRKLGALQFERDPERGFPRRRGLLRNILKNFAYPAVLDYLFYVKNKGDTSLKGKMPIINKIHSTVLKAQKQGFQNLVILAHSLGSVAVYDYVFRFVEKYPFPRNMNIRALVTFGSPIPLFVSAMGFPISTKIKKPLYIKKWINLWDHDDPIAGRCEPHFKRDFVKGFLRDIPVNTALLNPLRAHQKYWSNREVRKQIAGALVNG